MREIKFRAWDKVNKEMWKVLQLPLSFPCNTLLLHSYYDEGETMQEGKNIDNYIFMQFTGLLDKNGKEIYEGDVLSYPIPNDEMRGVIIWGKYEYIVEYSYENADYLATIGEDGCEVIGNIYEHPDLLKGN
jgi:uncharacterized phage protein (TIGR01671 family)